MTWLADRMSRPPSRVASSSRSTSERRMRKASTRVASTRSRTSAPACSPITSPRTRPSSRMSSRSGASSARSSAVSPPPWWRRSATSTVASDMQEVSGSRVNGSCRRRPPSSQAWEAIPAFSAAIRRYRFPCLGGQGAFELVQGAQGQVVTGSDAETELLDRPVDVTALDQQQAQVVVAEDVARTDAGAVGLLGRLLVAELVAVEVAQRQPRLRLAELGTVLEHPAGLVDAPGVAQQPAEVGPRRRVVRGAVAQLRLQRRVERHRPAPAGDHGGGDGVAERRSALGGDQRLLALPLLAEQERQAQPAGRVTGLTGAAVGAH